ncbi:Phosphatidylinositol/phosphatidylcholine transfer protein SFH6 [Folsomia candida]|uniref:Phosphatidylinositol/phosphatidylcholine transfer protein SFH6 n=1 Tax=Folsomia candida TaxID=158441 RepID=A0A226DVD1_FOLCA|nr:Phosphatidylinositol/phosphatidylcholine transfer protein SFH6 [Folsomia candida]
MSFNIVFLFVMILFPSLSNQTSLQEDLTLTQTELEILTKFRELVKSRLPHDYMTEDIYLITWLRAKKFEIPAAENMLMEEDWSDFEQEFRFEIQGCDKEGRPVVSIPVGDWDVRRAVLAGQSDKLIRYFDKLLEEVTTLIRDAQKSGENMTRFNHIMDMANYNLRIQACPLCPPIFLSLWQIIREFLSPVTKDAIKLYGKDKSEWQTALLENIDASQLSKEFGGLNDEGFSMEEIRKLPNLKCSRYANKIN